MRDVMAALHLFYRSYGFRFQIRVFFFFGNFCKQNVFYFKTIIISLAYIVAYVIGSNILRKKNDFFFVGIHQYRRLFFNVNSFTNFISSKSLVYMTHIVYVKKSQCKMLNVTNHRH